MKKLALSLILFMMIFKTYSLELEASLIFGEAAPGFEASSASVDFINAMIVLPITFQDKSGVGFTFSPVCLFSKKDEPFSKATLVNPLLFYNFFRDKYLRLGPFVSMNALDLYNINSFRFTAGVLFSWQPLADIFDNPLVPIFFQVAQIQAGYTYYENKGQFYMRIGFDLFGLLCGATANERKKYSNEAIF